MSDTGEVLLLQIPAPACEEAIREGYSIYLDQPLGLGYLSAIARDAGFRAQILLPRNLQEMEEMLEQARQPMLVGISLPFSGTIQPILNSGALGIIRRQVGANVPVVGGGHAATATARWLLEQAPELDAVCVGEGERTFLSLASRLQTGEDWREIPGLMVRRESEIFFNGPGLLAEDLDELPLPDRSWITGNPSQIFMIGSRGCKYGCTFCDIPQFYGASQTGGKRVWRGRSPESIVAEMQTIRASWPQSRIIMIDDEALVGRSTEDVLRLATTLRDAQLGEDLSFELTTSARSIIRCREAFAIFREAGLRIVYYGADSGSTSQLRRYKKPATVEMNLRAAEILVAAGIAPSIGLITFDPEVTFDELEENLNFFEAMSGIAPISTSLLTNRLSVYAGAPLAGDKADAGDLLLPLPPPIEELLAEWRQMTEKIAHNYAVNPPRKLKPRFAKHNYEMRLAMAKILARRQVIAEARQILARYRRQYKQEGNRSRVVELPVIS